jgi:dCTP deaminase
LLLRGSHGDEDVWVLDGQEILQALQHHDQENRLIVEPEPNSEALAQRGRIDLHVGPQAIRFESRSPTPNATVEAQFEDVHLLQPGELVLNASAEYIEMPPQLVGQVVTDSSLSRRGLTSVTAVRIQPRSKGHITLEVVNLGNAPILLARGQVIGHLVLSRIPDLGSRAGHYTFHPFVEEAEANLLLSFADGNVTLIAEVAAGQRVLGPGDDIFDIVNGAAFSAAVLLPALREFEDLIEAPDIREAEIQRFLEAYPEFITGFDYVEAIPHVVLELEAGSRRIPDFVLRPIGSDPCDLLEVKRPALPVITNVAGRPVLSRAAAAGVAQLLEYADIVRSSSVQERVRRRYGLEIAYPRLQLLVGRIRGVSAAAIRQAAWATGVDVRTYDDLLARAHLRLMTTRSDRRKP